MINTMDKHIDRIASIYEKLNRVEHRLNELELCVEEIRQPKEPSTKTN